MQSRAVTVRPPGVREQGRTDRLRRLHQAALDVFRSRGYDAATTREIAQAAGVAVGTVFVHAKDKRDLLFLVINDDLDEVLQRSLSAVSQPGPVLDQLMALIGPIYEYFASDPKLARAALREAVYFDIQEALSMGEQARRYVRRMDAWMRALTDLLNQAKPASGGVAPGGAGGADGAHPVGSSPGAGPALDGQSRGSRRCNGTGTIAAYLHGGAERPTRGLMRAVRRTAAASKPFHVNRVHGRRLATPAHMQARIPRHPRGRRPESRDCRRNTWSFSAPARAPRRVPPSVPSAPEPTTMISQCSTQSISTVLQPTAYPEARRTGCSTPPAARALRAGRCRTVRGCERACRAAVRRCWSPESARSARRDHR